MNINFLKFDIGQSIIILTLFFSGISLSQNTASISGFKSNPFIYNCVTLENSSDRILPNPYGFIKPAFTDIDANHPEAYFPVMIIFVQFANETGPDISWWPVGLPPAYMNEMLAVSKKYPVGGNWWDTYIESKEILSDYWLEQSRGRFHVTGKAYSVILDHDYIYYQTHGGFAKINEDMYEKLKLVYGVDWREYDKWKIDHSSSGTIFTFEPDGYVDMIYKVHRTHAPRIGMPAGGVAVLGETYSQGVNYLVDTLNNIFINGTFFNHGSGLTLSPGFGGSEYDSTYVPYLPLVKYGITSFSEHEHGHYLYGSGHTGYGKMSGSGAPYGSDECLSPWESIYIGYMVPQNVDFDVHEYSLGDYSSRNANPYGEVLQVPIQSMYSGEAFLIANRRKISSYDRIMWGDTAHGDPYRVINFEYGKGIYIYHITSGYVFYPTYLDQECADGLYSWDFAGYRHPDWSNEQNVDYFVKSKVSYNNDRSSGSYLNADGKSILNWFGTGKLHRCIGCDGTDKIYANNTDVWTSREFQGDRWDAWNVGYNEMFSPYSSPSTNTWDNENSGLFMWYYDNDPYTKNAKLKIFQTGYNGLTEDSILALTPPSKPMGVSATFSECINGYKYPKIYWLHNMEPDMINQTVQPFDMKFYNIYYAKSSDISIAPLEYSYIGTVNISKDSVPYYIDFRFPVTCTGIDTTVEVLRYTVTAVDAKGWQSVKSDFSAVICTTGSVFKNIVYNISPLTFALHQNYPNPFNPVTKINYIIPNNGVEIIYHVQMTIYNVLGQEIIKLVNEFKPSGKYEVVFNGSSLPSGVYFYVLDTPGYKAVKKMVLIK